MATKTTANPTRVFIVSCSTFVVDFQLTGAVGLTAQYSADYSDAALVEAWDALRRLGRIDLAIHYPHIGVTMEDTCNPVGR